MSDKKREPWEHPMAEDALKEIKESILGHASEYIESEKDERHERIAVALERIAYALELVTGAILESRREDEEVQEESK